MECTDQIKLQGNAPGKIKGDFSGNDLPKSIRVKGSADVNHVSASGNWISKNKYTSLAITIEGLDDNNNVIKECKYDEQGKFIPPITNACFVSYASPYLTFTTLDNNTLEINLFLSSEKQVISHDVMRKGENDNAYKQIGNSIPFDINAKGFYSLIDSAPLTGSTLYLIRTNFLNCASKDSDPVTYLS